MAEHLPVRPDEDGDTICQYLPAAPNLSAISQPTEHLPMGQLPDENNEQSVSQYLPQASASSAEQQDCFLCGEILSNPVIFSCSGVFCKKCIIMYAMGNSSNSRITCHCDRSLNMSDVGNEEISLQHDLADNHIAIGRYCTEEGHKEQINQLYCRTHCKAICGKCIVGTHRGCEFTDADHIVEKNKELADIISKADFFYKTLDATEIQIKKSFRDAEDTITELRETALPVYARLKSATKAIREEAESMRQEDEVWLFTEDRKKLELKLEALMRENVQCLVWMASLRTVSLDDRSAKSESKHEDGQYITLCATDLEDSNESWLTEMESKLQLTVIPSQIKDIEEMIENHRCLLSDIREQAKRQTLIIKETPLRIRTCEVCSKLNQVDLNNRKIEEICKTKIKELQEAKE